MANFEKVTKGGLSGGVIVYNHGQRSRVFYTRDTAREEVQGLFEAGYITEKETRILKQQINDAHLPSAKNFGKS